MADDFEQIGPEVERQLGEIQRTANDPELQQLWEELERVPFNPDFEDPDRRGRTVIINGHTKPVYHYNNFPILLSRVEDELSLRPPRDEFARAIISTAEEKRLQVIFGVLRHQLPRAYQRVLEIDRQIQATAGGDQPPAPLSDEDKYTVSQVYGEAASLARQLDPNYDLAYLRF